MILIDTKGHEIPELMPHIKKQNVPAEATNLQFGDAAFEGNGPGGRMMVGVERKKIHDMLGCIDDARYSAHQRLGMSQTYQVSALIVEGSWKPHDENGALMEGFHGGINWGYLRTGRGKVMYSKLRRYLFSVSLSGVLVLYSRDAFQTAFDICELFHYFQKPWTGHTSLLELQKVVLPSLGKKPGLTRRWASELTGVGTKMSLDAEKVFKTPIALATSDEMQWLQIPGVGVKTAQGIIREIWGTK